MTDMLRLDGPVDILVTLGLTLPSISDAEIDGIRLAAPPGSDGPRRRDDARGHRHGRLRRR